MSPHSLKQLSVFVSMSTGMSVSASRKVKICSYMQQSLKYIDVYFIVNCIMCYMSYSLAVFITILYWSLLYNGGPHPSYINLYVHGLQAFSIIILGVWSLLFSFYRVCLLWLTYLCQIKSGILKKCGLHFLSLLFMSYLM